MDQIELYHHGILGQKWGVRRYQNYDGTYTRKGLQRYNKSRENYEHARSVEKNVRAAYKSGNGSKEIVRSAKADTKAAKRQMDRDYKQLKHDKLADQGKELYRSGKTITGNAFRDTQITTAANVGALLAAKSLTKVNAGKVLMTKYGNVRIDHLSTAAIALGTNAFLVGMKMKSSSDNRKLREYYTHSRSYKG